MLRRPDSFPKVPREFATPVALSENSVGRLGSSWTEIVMRKLMSKIPFIMTLAVFHLLKQAAKDGKRR